MRKQVEPEWGEQISMQIPVLIESVAGNGFRASGGEPLAISAGGHARRSDRSTEESDCGSACCRCRVDQPGRGNRGSSSGPVPGWSEGDPLLDEWQEAIETYRRHVESDPDR